MAGARALKRVFVGNIPWTISSRELKQYFQQFGFVTQARVIVNRQTGFSKGYGFIHFRNPESVENASKVTKHELEGHNLIVQPSADV